MMHSIYLCEADLTMFQLRSTIAGVITLAFEMPGAFALATLVFQMWAIFAPVEVSTAEAWRRRIVLRRLLGWLALLKRWVLTALPTFLQWLLYGVQVDVVGEGDEGGNNVVETHLITILVKLL